DNDTALDHFRKAAQLGKDDASIQGWTARFLLKVKKDQPQALQFYLNAYFLDPHFYDTEYAEGRIRSLNFDQANLRFREARKNGASLPRLLDDENPVVVSTAIHEMSKSWDAAFVKPLINVLSHDDDAVRWAATKTIMDHVDREFDASLRAWLRD